jgi:hypothetical protein
MQDGTIRAFVFTKGTLQPLLTLTDDAFQTVAPCCNNINNPGQIVGFSVDSSFVPRAVIWQTKDQTPVDLNTRIPADSPWYLIIPAGINDAGEITATALNLNTFELHAVLLSPNVGVGREARGATKSPILTANVRKNLERDLRH